MLVGPLDLDRLATAIAPDLAFVDHVTLGMGSVRTSRDSVFRVDDVLGSRPDALLVRWTNFGMVGGRSKWKTDHAAGGTYERHRLVIWTFGADGLLARWEQFDPDRDDEALARFDELMAAPSRTARRHGRVVRPNAATANAAAIDAVIATRDPRAIAQI